MISKSVYLGLCFLASAKAIVQTNVKSLSETAAPPTCDTAILNMINRNSGNNIGVKDDNLISWSNQGILQMGMKMFGKSPNKISDESLSSYKASDISNGYTEKNKNLVYNLDLGD